MNAFVIVATVSYFTMVTGLFFRKNTKIHYKLMSVAILLDVSIVLVLQIKKHAVHTALSFALSPLQQAHIGASTVATLLYFPTLILGTLLLKRLVPESFRSWHIRLGITAFIFRTLGFLLMFSLVGRGR